MAFIPTQAAALVEVRFELHNQSCENTLWFAGAGNFNATTLENLCQVVMNWWINGPRLSLSNDLRLREVYATDQSSQTGFSHTLAAPANTVGGVVGPADANNVALCLSFRTARRGRSFRGRNYVAGIPKAQVTNSEVSEATANTLRNTYNTLLGFQAAHNFAWGVVSKYANNAPRAAGIFTTVTSVVIVDNTVDSQRRRLPGRGR